MCEKQISTENGVLTCDKAKGHGGMHHSKHKGGLVRDPYERKSVGGAPTRFQDDRGNFIMEVLTDPLEISWPQEGMNEPTAIKRG